MTVKELAEILLTTCDHNGTVFIADDCGCGLLKDEDIFQDDNGNVTFDISVASLMYKREQK